MRPTAVYRRLNKLIWMNRLPPAKIVLVDDDSLPECYGLTIHDDVVVRPVIFLNAKYKRWGKTLIHESLHVAEPSLRHGVVFDALVETYWRLARKYLKGLK